MAAFFVLKGRNQFLQNYLTSTNQKTKFIDKNVVASNINVHILYI